jgi:hypothetical protein
LGLALNIREVTNPSSPPAKETGQMGMVRVALTRALQIAPVLVTRVTVTKTAAKARVTATPVGAEMANDIRKIAPDGTWRVELQFMDFLNKN